MQNKIDFVNELSNIIIFKDNISNIESVEYQIFTNVNYPDRKQEFIRVNYVGGGYAVRNSNGNSLSAIFKEIGNLLDGGYYDEVDWYKENFLHNDEWELTPNYQH